MTVVTEANKNKARALLGELTLDEKIDMIHGAGLFRTEGVPRLGIPPFRMDDGPMGVRAEFHNASWDPLYNTRDYVTYLPCGSAVASTWNPTLAHETGAVLGAEARGRGKDMILGPSVNIKRSPLCGRNFEYMSEDPMLAAEQTVGYIEGVQESDVSACAKHFAANSQETNRLFVDESIGERAMHELYLPAFEAAVKRAGVLSVMGAYNLINGVRCCENGWMLDDVLRGEWNFDGFTVSDWSGVKRTKESAEVGLDVEMSITTNFDEYFFANPLKKAIARDEVSKKDVDIKVFRVLCVMDALHMLPNADGSRPARKSGSYATTEHLQSALNVARESVVLLKNDDAVLPIDHASVTRLLVVGANADRVHSNGGGSAEIKSVYEKSPLLALCSQLGGNVEVEYVLGYYAEEIVQDTSWQEGSLENPVSEDDAEGTRFVDTERSRTLREEAVSRAREYAEAGDPVVFVGGLDHAYDREGGDRTDMVLPYGQDALIEALLDAAPNTIVTFVTGSPVEMPWADRAKAIVWSWYAGSEGSTALAEVLTGAVNPSGHLPETFPLTAKDCPALAVGTFGLNDHVDYTEDIYVGYRYYETKDVPVRFCFGHGLSYTTFDYTDLDVRQVDDVVRVSCTVSNTGDRGGKTVVQMYFGLQCTGEDRPVKELKGFDKVDLAVGESRQVVVDIPVPKALGYWSNVSEKWAVAPSATVYVGESVKDIRLVGAVALG